MPTPTPIAKVSIGKSGYGVAHASYITRLSALDPDRMATEKGGEQVPDQPHLGVYEDGQNGLSSVRAALEENLDERALRDGKEHAGGDQRRSDPIWTWNAPEFLTGDSHGTRSDIGLDETREREGQLGLKEKVQNVKDYFASLEDYERRKGGRTHYRIILSFDVPATNEQIRDLTNKFLEQVFPKAIAFAAIHRDTEHSHVHLYLNSRQFDGKRIQLKNNEFKTIDEKWASVYSEFAGDKSVYIEYMRKKEETRVWKIAAAEAYRKGEPIPPKPERDNDRRERLAERRLSAQRSQARDRGIQPEARPQAEPVSRPASEKETSRLLAKEEVAREHLAHLIRTNAPEKEVKLAARTTSDVSAALQKTREERAEMGRERMPQVVYTTQEWKQLKEFRASSHVPVSDDQAAARLESGRVIAGAELRDAEGKADAFQASRQFWKFDVEGWDRGLSLREVELSIKTKSEERLKLYNFLRPSKREKIAGQIDYLGEVKKDIQKQLAARDRSINRNLAAAEARYETATTEARHSRIARAALGKETPAPVYDKEELARMSAIASRNKDAQLLGYVYDLVRDKLLQNRSQEALSRAKGRSVMAKMEMLKEAERYKAAARFVDFRQLARKDGQGFDNTKSVREVSPKNALETLIRHFTDTRERKKEGRELSDIASQEVRRAEDLSIKARDYSVTVDRILDDYCRVANVSSKQVGPGLNAEEIAQLREFSESLSPFSGVRKEFTDAARLAELSLSDREAARTDREPGVSRSQDQSARTREESRLQATQSNDRSDRDSSGRGR
jgi:hypothetical protein